MGVKRGQGQRRWIAGLDLATGEEGDKEEYSEILGQAQT